MNSFKNSVFRVISRIIRIRNDVQLAPIDLQDKKLLVENMKHFIQQKQRANLSLNIQKIQYTQLDEFQKKQYDVIKQYLETDDPHNTINQEDILFRVDLYNQLRKVKIMEENSHKYDPDVIKYERLKADFLLEKPGSEDALKNYLRDKPYIKPEPIWASRQEKFNTFFPRIFGN